MSGEALRTQASPTQSVSLTKFFIFAKSSYQNWGTANEWSVSGPMGAHGRDLEASRPGAASRTEASFHGGGMVVLTPTLGIATMASTPLAILLTIITVAAISVMTIFLMIDMETNSFDRR